MKNELQGSPPRVRELLFRAVWQDLNPRITPACAGITGRVQFFAVWREDHPRVCGNYSVMCADKDGQIGSPPRVRELLLEVPAHGREIGITPACAGITPSRE